MNETARMSGNPTSWVRRGATVLIASIALVGCGSGGYRTPPLDAALARDTLETVLENWKNGEKSDSLQESSPPIIAQDIDWFNGVQLLDYQVLDEGHEIDGNLVEKVILTLPDSRGGKTQKKVTYLVTTSPSLTVLRDIRQ